MGSESETEGIMDFLTYADEEITTATDAMADLQTRKPQAPAEPTAVEVELLQIVLDGDTQARAGLSQSHIRTLMELRKNGIDLGPIKIIRGEAGQLWLWDGFHRVEAELRLGSTMIMAEIKPGTLQEAQWLSFAANRHGLARTHDDISKAVRGALLHPDSRGLTDAAIARHVGCDPKTVGNWRRKLQESLDIPEITRRKVTRGGKTYYMDTTEIGSRDEEPESPAVEPVAVQEEPEGVAVIDSSSAEPEPLSAAPGQPQEPTATQPEPISVRVVYTEPEEIPIRSLESGIVLLAAAEFRDIATAIRDQLELLAGEPPMVAIRIISHITQAVRTIDQIAGELEEAGRG